MSSLINKMIMDTMRLYAQMDKKRLWNNDYAELL